MDNTKERARIHIEVKLNSARNKIITIENKLKGVELRDPFISDELQEICLSVERENYKMYSYIYKLIELDE